MDWIEVANKLEPYLKSGDLDKCIGELEGALKDLPNSPFHIVIGLDFTNKLADVAKYFTNFTERDSGKILAIYTETNGFEINPDCWYFDAFGFDHYGGEDDLDWICDDQFGADGSVILEGMEALQNVFDSDAFTNEDFDDASMYCSFLVMCKFQKLIRDSLELSTIEIPVLATTHGSDLIYKYHQNG